MQNSVTVHSLWLKIPPTPNMQQRERKGYLSPAINANQELRAIPSINTGCECLSFQSELLSLLEQVIESFLQARCLLARIAIIIILELRLVE